MQRNKFVIFMLVPLLFAMAMLALGFWLGRYSVQQKLQAYVAPTAEQTTIADVAERDDVQQIAQTYLDPARAAVELPGYLWEPPSVPTPFVGSAPRPGISHNAHINRWQFRGSREPVFPKPAGVYRIFIVGASTAFGVGAPSDETTIAGYLQTTLNDRLSTATRRQYEVFTFAQPAWSSTHERIAIENRVSELQPDLVLNFSGHNDVHWSSIGADPLWHYTYRDWHYHRILSYAYDAAGLEELPNVAPLAQQMMPPEMLAERLGKNVQLAGIALAMSRSRYVFVLQPNIQTTGKPLTVRETAWRDRSDAGYWRQCYDAFRVRLQAIIQSGALPSMSYWDLTSVFDTRSAGDEIFVDSAHFGDKGNQIIAAELADRIERLLHSPQP